VQRSVREERAHGRGGGGGLATGELRRSTRALRMCGSSDAFIDPVDPQWIDGGDERLVATRRRLRRGLAAEPAR
jgi:hypothetical protein